MKKEDIDRPIEESGKRKRLYSKPELTEHEKLKNVTSGAAPSPG